MCGLTTSLIRTETCDTPTYLMEHRRGGAIQKLVEGDCKVSAKIFGFRLGGKRCTQKFSLHFSTSIIANFSEIMQIEVMIAASEHRTISSTIFDAKKYH